MTSESADKLERYLSQVASHLADLPADERDELLGDLRQNLEAAADSETDDIEQRLGPPERFAEELRTSAGLPTRGRDRALHMTNLRAWLTMRPAPDPRHPGRRAVTSARRAWARVRAHPEVDRSIEGLHLAAPAWWVLRGYLAVVILDLITRDVAGLPIPLPSIGYSELAGLLAVVAAVTASVWVGRRADGHQTWRLLTRAGHVALGFGVVVGLATLNTATMDVASVEYVERAHTDYGDWHEDALVTPDGRLITNLYPYDAGGRPLDRVLLYDQAGRPVQMTIEQIDGQPVVTSYPVDVDGRPVTNAYPQRRAVYGGPLEGDQELVERPEVDPPRLATAATPSAVPSTATTSPVPDVTATESRPPRAVDPSPQSAPDSSPAPSASPTPTPTPPGRPGS